MNNNKLNFTHRGIHNSDIPENSIPSFEKSIELGFNIELDVKLTKDNKIVVFHDSNLKRLTGIDKDISKCDLDYIKSLRLNKTKYSIPTLEEVLKLINGKVKIYLEIKSENNTKKICTKILETISSYNGEILIASFNPFDLLWFKNNAPNYDRIQLSMNNFHKFNKLIRFILKNTMLNFLTRPTFISYKFDELSDKLEKQYNKENIKTLAWTIGNQKDFDIAIRKYNGVVFEGFIPK